MSLFDDIISIYNIAHEYLIMEAIIVNWIRIIHDGIIESQEFLNLLSLELLLIQNVQDTRYWDSSSGF